MRHSLNVAVFPAWNSRLCLYRLAAIEVLTEANVDLKLDSWIMLPAACLDSQA